MIVVVDYNMGNVGSIVSMLKKLKKDSIVSSDKKTIQDAEKIILPGVGSFDKAFSNIKKEITEACEFLDILPRII